MWLKYGGVENTSLILGSAVVFLDPQIHCHETFRHRMNLDSDG